MPRANKILVPTPPRTIHPSPRLLPARTPATFHQRAGLPFAPRLHPSSTKTRHDIRPTKMSRPVAETNLHSPNRFQNSLSQFAFHSHRNGRNLCERIDPPNTLLHFPRWQSAPTP